MSAVNWTMQDLIDRNRRYAERTALMDSVAVRLDQPEVEAQAGTPTPRPRREPGMPNWNKTEARYGQYLDLQKRAGTVLWWVFEGATLKLAPDTRYTPDFMVMMRHASSGLGFVEFHEVKGAKNGKPRYEDDARVKIACAAEKFRPIRFLMVWQARNGAWDSKEF